MSGFTGPSRRRTPGHSVRRGAAILACDFFTVGLLDGTQACVLAVIEHASRRIWGGSCETTRSTITGTGRTGR